MNRKRYVALLSAHGSLRCSIFEVLQKALGRSKDSPEVKRGAPRAPQGAPKDPPGLPQTASKDPQHPPNDLPEVPLDTPTDKSCAKSTKRYTHAGFSTAKQKQVFFYKKHFFSVFLELGVCGGVPNRPPDTLSLTELRVTGGK